MSKIKKQRCLVFLFTSYIRHIRKKQNGKIRKGKSKFWVSLSLAGNLFSGSMPADLVFLVFQFFSFPVFF